MLRIILPALLPGILAASVSMAWADDPAAGPEDGTPSLAPAEEPTAGHDTAAGADDTASHGAAGSGENDVSHGDGEHPEEHGDHDVTDLSHANAGDKLHDPSELRFDLAICTFLVFLVLLILLRAAAWKPIMKGLAQREHAIVSRIEQAEQQSEQAAATLREYQAKLAAAGDEAQAIIAQARKDAEAVADRIREEAKEDATRQRDRAIADIKAARNNAVRDVARQSADLAVSLAGRIVQRELKPEDHASLITDALQRFPSNN